MAGKNKYHLKANGEVVNCGASIRTCPRGEANHFDTRAAARKYYETLQESELIPLTLEKKKRKILPENIIPDDVSEKISSGISSVLPKIPYKEKKPSSPFKKFTKVSAGVLVAVVALNNISNIGVQEPEQVNAVPDDQSSVSVNDENFDIPKLPEIKENIQNIDKDDLLEKGKDALENGKNKVADGWNSVTDWAENNDTSQEGYNNAKNWLEDRADNISNYDFENILNFDNEDTNLNVENDGSITWGAKNLTPTNMEVKEAKETLKNLNVAPENTVVNYDREGTFGNQKETTKSKIEMRDLTDSSFNDYGRASSGTLKDPYTGKTLTFKEGDRRPYDLEHVVALKEVERSENANHPLTNAQKEQIANDSSNLLLVDSSANRSKSDKDAKTWLPSYKPSECRYAIETITVKDKYNLNVDQGEKEVLENVLNTRCEPAE